jgi:hypothetical protein
MNTDGENEQLRAVHAAGRIGHQFITLNKRKDYRPPFIAAICGCAG